MNRIEFKICIRKNYPEIRSVIDDLDLYGDEYIGITPSGFFTQDNFFGGELLIGICCCGCKGCDDYTVDVSLCENNVIWSDWRTKSKYVFGKSEYEKAIAAIRTNYYKYVEKNAEKYVSKMLRHIMTKDLYVFNCASASLKENIITLNYSNPDIKQPNAIQKKYEIKWDENDKWNIEEIRPKIQRFINVVLQEGEYMVDRALEITYDGILPIFCFMSL